jgi:GNAT superfamily N-acetyltransferase
MNTAQTDSQPMPQQTARFEISLVDPRTPEATGLIRSMSEEIAATYDHTIDGHGHFKPEDVLVPGAGFLVGRVGDRAVACGAFRPLEPGIAEIKRMFVAADHRGHGYSKQILATLERLAGESGYTMVRLETRPKQAAAIALYEGLGYVRIPNYGRYEGRDNCLCYEKPLSGARE